MKKLDVIKVERQGEDLLTCELMTINDDLEDFYREIGCSTIDIVCRKFGGLYFDVICDDEALLNGTPERVKHPCSWWQDKEEHCEGLWGTLLLCHHDDEGNLTDAQAEDLLAVQMSTRTIRLKNGRDLVMLFHNL